MLRPAAATFAASAPNAAATAATASIACRRRPFLSLAKKDGIYAVREMVVHLITKVDDGAEWTRARYYADSAPPLLWFGRENIPRECP